MSMHFFVMAPSRVVLIRLLKYTLFWGNTKNCWSHCIIAFCPEKNIDIYRGIFTVLKTSIGDRPIAMALDLELSVVSNLKELFGRSIDIRLCFFHFRCRLDSQFREKGLKGVLPKEDAKKLLLQFSVCASS